MAFDGIKDKNDMEEQIYKKEMIKLTRSGTRLKYVPIMKLNYINLNTTVIKFYQESDVNKDGYLDYDEFSKAILRNQCLLRPVWNNQKVWRN